MSRRQRARTGAAKHHAALGSANSNAMAPEIRVEIGEVVLHGIDIRDRNGLAVALEGELAAVLADADVTRTLQGGARDRVDGGVISLEANHSAPGVGRQIAHVVQRSLIGALPGAAQGKVSKH